MFQTFSEALQVGRPSPPGWPGVRQFSGSPPISARAPRGFVGAGVGVPGPWNTDGNAPRGRWGPPFRAARKSSRAGLAPELRGRGSPPGGGARPVQEAGRDAHPPAPGTPHRPPRTRRALHRGRVDRAPAPGQEGGPAPHLRARGGGGAAAGGGGLCLPDSPVETAGGGEGRAGRDRWGAPPPPPRASPPCALPPPAVGLRGWRRGRQGHRTLPWDPASQHVQVSPRI